MVVDVVVVEVVVVVVVVVVGTSQQSRGPPKSAHANNGGWSEISQQCSSPFNPHVDWAHITGTFLGQRLRFPRKFEAQQPHPLNVTLQNPLSHSIKSLVLVGIKYGHLVVL